MRNMTSATLWSYSQNKAYTNLLFSFLPTHRHLDMGVGVKHCHKPRERSHRVRREEKQHRGNWVCTLWTHSLRPGLLTLSSHILKQPPITNPLLHLVQFFSLPSAPSSMVDPPSNSLACHSTTTTKSWSYHIWKTCRTAVVWITSTVQVKVRPW
jgi:hypothetical protein